MKPSLLNFVGKNLLLFFISFTLFSKSYSQSFLLGSVKTKWEVGLNFGPSFFLGDLGGNKGVGKKFVKDLNLGKTNFAGSISLTAMYEYMLALRLEATFGTVEADDKVLAKVAPSSVAGSSAEASVLK